MVGKITSDTMLSGSQAAALVGEDHPVFGKSRNDLLHKILNARGFTEYPISTFDGNEACDWGNTLEPLIIAEAADRLNISKFDAEVETAYTYDDLFSVSLDAIFYNKKSTIYADDGIHIMNGAHNMVLEGPGACESKLTSALPIETPPPYRGPWQLQMQMMCAGYKWGVIATLYQGTKLVLNIYQADAEMQKTLIDAAKEFYTRLKTAPDGLNYYPVETAEDSKTVFGTGNLNDSFKDLDDIRDVVIDYITVQEELNNLTNRKKSISQLIMRNLGNHSQGFVNFGSDIQCEVRWPERVTKATPERVLPPQPEKIMRQSVVSISNAHRKKVLKWMDAG